MTAPDGSSFAAPDDETRNPWSVQPAAYGSLADQPTAGAMSAVRAVGMSATATDDGVEVTVRVTTK